MQIGAAITSLVDLSKAVVQPLSLPSTEEKNITIDVLRLDAIHPVISGNKWFKLKYYLSEAIAQGKGVVTFGGAYSNHLQATAFAAKQLQIPSAAIIRGERPSKLSPVLEDIIQLGMQTQFINRLQYSRKEEPAFLEDLSFQYPGYIIIPEGGAGDEGEKGCREILSLVELAKYSHVLCSIGTGTMWLGLTNAALPGQELIGIPVLKGMENLLAKLGPRILDSNRRTNSTIFGEYHFGGYAKKSKALFDFMNEVYDQYAIPTDFVYSAKMFHAAFELVKKNYFKPGATLLLIHCGGLQGNRSLPINTLHF